MKWYNTTIRRVHLPIPALITLGVLVILAPLFFYVSNRFVYAERIFPDVSIGSVAVGGLPFDVARAKLKARVDTLSEEGIAVIVDGQTQQVRPTDVGLSVDIDTSIQAASKVGRRAGLAGFGDMLVPFRPALTIAPAETLPTDTLQQEVGQLATLFDVPARSVRLHVAGTRVTVLTDTQAGLVLDASEVARRLSSSFSSLSVAPIAISRYSVAPVTDPHAADQAKAEAQRMIAAPITLVDQGKEYVIDSATIGTWITSKTEQGRVVVSLDPTLLSTYVADFAQKVNQYPQNLGVQVDANNQVVGFTAPRPGRIIQEDVTIHLLSNLLNTRAVGQEKIEAATVTLPMIDQEPLTNDSAAALGIKELIGTATTPFTGSPPNRIANIKNGTRFLSGQIIKSGEEFSTLKALGTIDNTTGYLPELVIKGNRTTPEFGGGLCQVSTTLFRSVLNAGLPVKARQNHSYRVTYYEKDGDGKQIGPGLDATIYQPAPDFKFLNDTGNSILISGYVVGDRLTFALYGTRDGRTSAVDGPHLLTSTPSGEPIYAETDTLPPGTKKQIEKPHAGGSAIATYHVTYADGHEVTQVFKSFYRPWPAQFLVGVAKAEETTPGTTPDPSIPTTQNPPVPLTTPAPTNPST